MRLHITSFFYFFLLIFSGCAIMIKYYLFIFYFPFGDCCVWCDLSIHAAGCYLQTYICIFNELVALPQALFLCLLICVSVI